MAFLVAQELSGQVSSKLSEAPSIPAEGEWPPWTPRGLNADAAPPVPSGPLPSSAGFSPSALNGICSGRLSWPLLSVVRRTRMPISSRATQTVTLPTRVTELRAMLKQGADSSALEGWPCLQVEAR